MGSNIPRNWDVELSSIDCRAAAAKYCSDDCNAFVQDIGAIVVALGSLLEYKRVFSAHQSSQNTRIMSDIGRLQQRFDSCFSYLQLVGLHNL